MSQSPDIRMLGDSLPPSTPRQITWPVVAYAFMRELPYTLMVVGGTVLGVVFVLHGPASAFEPLAAVLGPAIVSALGRSRPAEDGARLGMLAALLSRLKGWS